MIKNRLSRDYKPGQLFLVELSTDQMQYISGKLPFGYTLLLEPKKNVPKHILQATKKKAIVNPSEDSNSHAHSINQSQGQQKKALHLLPNNSQKAIVNTIAPPRPPQNPNNKWIDSISNESLKKAAKILVLLKSHKCGWPFLEPVDSNALGIPEYYEIIKEPMDLQSIQNKLKTQKYTDFSEFHKDIMKIVENSFKFNQANQDYLKITSEFENYYNKVASEINQDNKNNNKNAKKKKKPATGSKQFSESVPVTLNQKKLLAQQIQRLGKQHLKGVCAIVFEGGQQKDSFDLEKLGNKKIRDLQKYVRNLIVLMEDRIRSSQMQKVQINNLSMCESDESPFLTDNEQE